MTSAEIQPTRLKNEAKPIPEWPSAPHDPDPVSPPQPVFRPRTGRFARIIRVMITLGMVALAAWFGWAMWKAYMEAPWTRDSTVRAYVVSMAPEVSGRIVQLPVIDNQFVHKGDLLVVIDKTDFKIALDQAEAQVEQAQVSAENAQRQAERRRKLTTLEVAMEQKQNFETSAVSTRAQYRQARGQSGPGQGQSGTHRDTLAGQRLGHQSVGAAGRLRLSREEYHFGRGR